jgi:hypothetical protein
MQRILFSEFYREKSGFQVRRMWNGLIRLFRNCYTMYSQKWGQNIINPGHSDESSTMFKYRGRALFEKKLILNYTEDLLIFMTSR